MEGDNNLNTNFKLYFHDPDSYNWSKESYVELYNIKSIEDYWITQKRISDVVHQGMFFIMRENIFPLWDNEENKKGCTFSFKILKSDAKSFWEKFTVLLLSDNLVKDNKEKKKINGISISPKKNFCIIKIWLNDNRYVLTREEVRERFEIPNNYEGEIIIKSNS